MLMGGRGNALDALDKYAHSPRIETVTLRYLSASSIATAMTSLQQLPVLTLLSLEAPLSIHFSAQTINHFDLLLVSIFLFVSPLALFFIQLPIT